MADGRIGNHPRVAHNLMAMANVYGSQGKYAEAEALYKRALAIEEKVFGLDPTSVAQTLYNLATVYGWQGKYADAEPLFKRGLSIYEKTFGPNHPDVASSLNQLASLYNEQGRYADALPILRRTTRQGVARKDVTFPVLLQSARRNLISHAEAFAGSYETLQRASASAAGDAVSKLAARFAAGTGQLAEVVRKDQDVAAEAERLDKNLIAAVSKIPADRNSAAEDQTRKRIDGIRSERDKLQEVFNQRFPDYVALSKPEPLSLKDTQALLADDEALVVFDFGAKSYAWIITRNDADWTELPISAKDLDALVKGLRISLSFKVDARFDADLAFNIYQATFGTIADKIATKGRLSVVTNGALTSLPPQLLVTKDPSGKKLKDVDWLVRSYAVTILPSVASLKTLRTVAATSSAAKPIIAFADPVFSKAARRQAQPPVAMRSITSFYSGTQIDVASLAEYLPQLPETRGEVETIGRALKADASDIKLGLAATETEVKRTKLDQYRIVYFATHALVAGDLEQFAKSKAEPALVLTIPDKPTEFDNGLLSASDIAQLKLNADWVVLSACNTAAEGEPGAEPLSGLARAFFYSGARSLLVSHWEVESDATAQLMVSIFQANGRNPKLSHAQALRQAMLEMIDQAKSDDEAHPRLWAPFVIVGEPALPR